MKIKFTALYRRLKEHYFMLIQKDMPADIIPFDVTSTLTKTPRNLTFILSEFFPNEQRFAPIPYKSYVPGRSSKVKKRKVKHDPNAIPNYYWPWINPDRMPTDARPPYNFDLGI